MQRDTWDLFALGARMATVIMVANSKEMGHRMGFNGFQKSYASFKIIGKPHLVIKQMMKLALKMINMNICRFPENEKFNLPVKYR